MNLPASLAATMMIIAGAAPSASADIILLDQNREIMARAEDPSSPFVESYRSSAGAGAFIDSVDVMAGAHWGNAFMDSFIGAHTIRATARVEGMGDLGFPMGHGEGGATLSARFEVIDPIPFRLSGHLESFGSDAGGGLALTGPGGAVLNLVAYSGGSGIEYFDESGTLDPGIYELVANVGASVFSPPGANAGFDLRFDLPAPGATVVLIAGLALAARRRR